MWAEMKKKCSVGIDWLRGRRSSLQEEPSEYERLCMEIEKAHLEWSIAQQHIDYVSEPALIDHSIYYLEAAERKYGYLLQEAKRRYQKDQQVATLEPSL